jgi:type II secretory pathway component PulF
MSEFDPNDVPLVPAEEELPSRRARRAEKEPKPAREPKAPREPKPPREPKVKAEKPAKEPRAPKEPKPPREPKPAKEPRQKKAPIFGEPNLDGFGGKKKGQLPDVSKVEEEEPQEGKRRRPKWAQYERNPKKGEVAESIRSLGVMLSTSRGETIPLATLAEQYKGTELGSAYGRIYNVIQSGQMDLAEAFSAESRIFPKVVADLLLVGVRSGNAADNLQRAADILDEGADLNAKIKAAVLQPAILLGVIIIFMYAVIFFFLPPFAQMFKAFNKPLPPLSQAIMVGGNVFAWVGVALVFLSFLWFIYYKVWGKHVHHLRLWLGKAQLGVPVIGKVVQSQRLTQTFATLGGLLSVGLSERDALITAAEACPNYALKTHLRDHATAMDTGKFEFADVADGKLIPLQAGFMLRNGFDAGQEVRSINDLASMYRRDANKRAANLTQAMEPIANGLVSLVMAVVVIATYLPVYDLFSTMSAV